MSRSPHPQGWLVPALLLAVACGASPVPIDRPDAGPPDGPARDAPVPDAPARDAPAPDGPTAEVVAPGVDASCGGPGEACCATAPACGNGACCLAGSCVSAPCETCGKRGMACCSGSLCDRDLFCENKACAPCGQKPGDPCCAGGLCAGGACCMAGRCLAPGQACATPPACGGKDQPCCAGNRCDSGGCCLAGRCLMAGSACMFAGKTYGTCQSGQCGCGVEGKPCCPIPDNGSDADACGATLHCTGIPDEPGSVCAPCGHLGGSCCPGKRCLDPGVACRGQNPDGFRCRKCGGNGEPCCLNYMGAPLCDAALVCTAGSDGTSRCAP